VALPVLSAVLDEFASPPDEGRWGDAVWRADALARHASPGGVLATGHAVLDAQLPGGGWPVGGLCEVLQTHSAQHLWRLLLPALCAAQGSGLQQAGKPAPWVVLIGPPLVPFGPALAAQGLDVQHLLLVKVDAPAERLWAAEQALRCGGVAAVLAWLPQVQAAPLRRLQMAAQTHAKLLFVMRPAAALGESSPAVLRLLVGSSKLANGTVVGNAFAADRPADADPDALCVRVLKRRGPPLTHTLVLPAPVPGLAELLAIAARSTPNGCAHGPVVDQTLPDAANWPSPWLNQATPCNLAQSRVKRVHPSSRWPGPQPCIG
jgi:protein ImuA